jgi:hypothetical protein
MHESYKAPDVPIEQVTPQFVRDELLTCFESANREFADVLHQEVTDEALKSQVKQFVTTVFSNCGVSFAEPNKAGVLTAMEECKKNAQAMMGPQGSGIIQHHYDEMLKLVSKLPD